MNLHYVGRVSESVTRRTPTNVIGVRRRQNLFLSGYALANPTYWKCSSSGNINDDQHIFNFLIRKPGFFCIHKQSGKSGRQIRI